VCAPSLYKSIPHSQATTEGLSLRLEHENLMLGGSAPACGDPTTSGTAGTSTIRRATATANRCYSQILHSQMLVVQKNKPERVRGQWPNGTEKRAAFRSHHLLHIHQVHLLALSDFAASPSSPARGPPPPSRYFKPDHYYVSQSTHQG